MKQSQRLIGQFQATDEGLVYMRLTLSAGTTAFKKKHRTNIGQYAFTEENLKTYLQTRLQGCRGLNKSAKKMLFTLACQSFLGGYIYCSDFVWYIAT